MLQPLTKIVEARLPLRDVGVSMLTPAIVGSVELYFGDEGIQIAATPDTDEILLSVVEEPQSVQRLASCPFERAVGKPVFLAWAGSNDRGYREMVQLCFGRDVEDEHIVVHVQAMASGITFWSVCPVGPPFAT